VVVIISDDQGYADVGIRVPFFIQWKRRLPAGKTYDQPVIALDIFPTAVAAAGGTMPADRPIDGVNLLPYLEGKKPGPPHDALFWRMGPRHAVRKGTWKLVQMAAQPALYDLAADIGETTDLAADKPDILKDLADTYAAWDAQMAKPLWAPPRRGPRRKRQPPR